MKQIYVGYTFLAHWLMCEGGASERITFPLCGGIFSRVIFASLFFSLLRANFCFEDCDGSGFSFSKQAAFKSLDKTRNGLACAAVVALLLGEDVCRLRLMA